MSNLIDKIKSYGTGLSVLMEWLGDDAICVDQHTAQVRTNTCLVCPLHSEGSLVTEAVAKAIKNQVDIRNKLGLKTAGIKSLKFCGACNCYMPLKIFIPIERIAPDDELKEKLDPKCWMLSESGKL